MVSRAVISTVESLTISLRCVARLRENISQVATARKLLGIGLRHKAHTPPAAYQKQKQRQMTDLEQSRWRHEQGVRGCALHVPYLTKILRNAVMGMDDDSRVSGDSTLTQRNTSSGQVHTSSHTRAASSTGPSGLVLEAAWGQAQEGEVVDPEVTSVLKHQLTTILAVMLVELCMWRLEYEGTDTATSHDTPPEWWVTILKIYASTLPSRGLQAVMTSLLGDSTGPRAQSEVAAVWERFAVTHFNGRLLPGCCNLGCTNLSGVSEATLKTQLCGRCRGPRYCSTECQRSAWLEGGHSTVCVQAGRDAS